jgi:hypothetical protein
MIAEGGVAACQRPELIWKCADNLAGLPKADGVVLADPNWGMSAMTLFSIDPAVRGPGGQKLDSKLDMFNPANGFKPTGSTYGAAFIGKFLGAEGRRSTAILRQAQAR